MKQTNLTIVKFNRIEAISISPSEKRKGCQNGCSQSFLVSVLLWASGSVKENLTQFPFIKRSNTLGVNTIFFSFLTEICSSTRWEKLTLTPKSAKNQFKEKTQISYHSWINEKMSPCEVTKSPHSNGRIKRHRPTNSKVLLFGFFSIYTLFSLIDVQWL